MNLTRGLILTLSLALAATVSGQQSITGHDIKPAPDSDVPEFGHDDRGDDKLSQLELEIEKEKVLAEVEAALNEAEAFIDLLVFSDLSSSEAKKLKELLKAHSRALWGSASQAVKSAASREALEFAKNGFPSIENRWAATVVATFLIKEMSTFTGYEGMDCTGTSEDYYDPYWPVFLGSASEGEALEYANQARQTTADEIRKDGYLSYRRTRKIGECIRL